MPYMDLLKSKNTLSVSDGTVSYFDLTKLEKSISADISKLPFSIKIMLESILRNLDDKTITQKDVKDLANWAPGKSNINVPLKLARVILQDFTGVPAVVDLAALRSAMERAGKDPAQINPIVPVDLVVDHSVQVDYFGTNLAFEKNVDLEYQRNKERYSLLKWAQNSIDNFRVVPPGMGIVHQVNLEYLAQVVMEDHDGDEIFAVPDSLVGTDSHTTMVNGLGVLGWGVGGIEAEAVMLGQPYYMLAPEVVGFKLEGALREGTTATDLVLTITEMLRAHGVVSKFVEFYGPGLSVLPLADRATIANMAPEYGATMGFFPVDNQTLNYLSLTGRNEKTLELVEKYSRAQGLFREDTTPDPVFSETLSLDMSSIVPSISGPKRPQDRIILDDVKKSFYESLGKSTSSQGFNLPEKDHKHTVAVSAESETVNLKHGSVVIAAITSCTNTSNPSVMVGAGILAKNASKLGLNVKSWVKTSMAPGSKVVTGYLNEAGLMPYLEEQGFHTVGFGCTTCIGNSGPLPDHIASGIEEGDLVAAAVLSGNRNFEGRVNPHVKANYLASPILVVAYALAGRIDINFDNEPLGSDQKGQDVFLKDIWPEQNEIQKAISNSISPEMFGKEYGTIFDGDEKWAELPAPKGELYEWENDSTYIQEPSFFKDFPIDSPPVKDITQARILAILGDSVTTDHISPAGNIAQNSPAASYLGENGNSIKDFNSYGSRRGAHEVMMRGTFANIRLKNNMLKDVEGGYTMKWPEGIQMSIFDAASQYQASNTPLIIIGGKEYGSGSSRDWAAKGPFLLGVRAVIAQSYERIHRSNLVGMGILPLEFQDGDDPIGLNLTGKEIINIVDVEKNISPGQLIKVSISYEDGKTKEIITKSRIDTRIETEYYSNGGILQTVLRNFIKSS